MTSDFDLDLFVQAQDGCIEDARKELMAGQKRTHWMWFIFPQVTGLGRSVISQRFAIKSLTHAKAYLGHPVLGERIISCTEIVNKLEGRSIHDIFGSPDDLKFHSSMTLFREVAGTSLSFATALDRYFSGIADELTLQIIRKFG